MPRGFRAALRLAVAVVAVLSVSFAVASPAAAQAGCDQMDLSQATVYNSPPDIAQWKVTGSITQLTMSRPAGLAFTFTTHNTWPDYTPPGWSGPIEYTVWAVVKINGHWYTSGFIQMWRDRPSTGAPILTDFAINWAYDSRWGPMNHYQPHVGEQMGFFVSAGNARGTGGVTSARERTNVVVVSLPANDAGVFNYPAGNGGCTTFDGDLNQAVVLRNYSTGANMAVYLDGTSLAGTGSLPPVTDLGWQLVAQADFNGDGHVDLLWRHAGTGQNLVWRMNKNTLAGTTSLPSAATGWRLAAAVDMNGDGSPDLVWRNIDGSNLVWYMNGLSMDSTAALPAQTDMAWQLAVVADVNHDGSPDLIWRNGATGENKVWFMNGLTHTSSSDLQTVPVDWQMVGAADLNADATPDIIWHNSATGQNVAWYMSGGISTGGVNLPTVADTNWEPPHAMYTSGNRDFNGDSGADIIWRNTASGQNVVWFMNGSQVITSTAMTPSVVSPTWQLSTTADFNGDGQADLVWRNSVTGQNLVWFMRDKRQIGSAMLPTVGDPGWKIVGSGDFNHDGKPDLVFRHQTSGANVVWLMNGVTLSSVNVLPTVSNPWQIAAAADMDGDGWADLLWRNAATGANLVWLMQNLTVTSNVALPTILDVDWQLGQAVDMDGDGKVDFIVRNRVTGQNRIIFLDGLNVLGSVSLPTVADTRWTIIP